MALVGEVVVLSREELDRLLEALVGLERPAAASIADQIAALRLAGGTLDLTPTEAELAALCLALGAVGSDSEPTGRALARLAAIYGEPSPGLPA